MADITDALADAIIGAVLIARIAASTADRATRPIRGVKDLTPESDKVFTLPEDTPRLGPFNPSDLERERRRADRSIADAQREDEEWVDDFSATPEYEARRRSEVRAYDRITRESKEARQRKEDEVKRILEYLRETRDEDD